MQKTKPMHPQPFLAPGAPQATKKVWTLVTGTLVGRARRGSRGGGSSVWHRVEHPHEGVSRALQEEAQEPLLPCVPATSEVCVGVWREAQAWLERTANNTRIKSASKTRQDTLQAKSTRSLPTDDLSVFRVIFRMALINDSERSRRLKPFTAPACRARAPRLHQGQPRRTERKSNVFF